MCPQPTGNTQIRDQMSEDCLYLNVWTPTLDPASSLPVMVYIHGGSLVARSGGEPGNIHQYAKIFCFIIPFSIFYFI